MTQKVNPSFDRPADSFKTAGAIALAGGSSEGWVSPAAETSIVSEEDVDITDSALNAFAESSSGTSLDVTIDPGEAFVYGSWVAIDIATTVTLAASTTAQTVYVGWGEGDTDNVIIGLDAAYGATDKRIPLYDFDTDGSGVTNVTDRRELGQFQSVSHAEIIDELGIPVYADSSNAPQEEGTLIYVDGSGTESVGAYIHTGSEYVDAGSTQEEIEDVVNALLTGGTNVSLTYDDANDTLTIDTSALNQEEVEDTVNTLIADGNAIDTTYDDSVDTLTIAVVESDIALGNLSGDTDDVTEGTSNLYYTDERVDDEVNSLIADGNAISSTYDDVNDTLTIAVTETEISLGNLAGDTDNVDEGTTNLYFADERAQDAVGGIVGSLLRYDDATPAIVIDIGDDQELTFGTGDDMSVRYDSTNDSFRWQDAASGTDRMELDRTSGNLQINGEITENASL